MNQMIQNYQHFKILFQNLVLNLKLMIQIITSNALNKLLKDVEGSKAQNLVDTLLLEV